MCVPETKYDQHLHTHSLLTHCCTSCIHSHTIASSTTIPGFISPLISGLLCKRQTFRLSREKDSPASTTAELYQQKSKSCYNCKIIRQGAYRSGSIICTNHRIDLLQGENMNWPHPKLLGWVIWTMLCTCLTGRVASSRLWNTWIFWRWSLRRVEFWKGRGLNEYKAYFYGHDDTLWL